MKSWREVAEVLQSYINRCTRKWEDLRGRFAKIKKNLGKTKAVHALHT